MICIICLHVPQKIEFDQTKHLGCEQYCYALTTNIAKTGSWTEFRAKNNKFRFIIIQLQLV